jgi:hypothetical protein
MPEIADIAETWGCSERTAARWKAQGAPLDNSARLRTWLAGRKNLPAATKSKLAVEAREVRANLAAATEPTGEVGAAAALRRLEETEAVSFRLLQAALKTGDPVEVKIARENWLRIGDSLRKYDIQVAAERRNSGELLPRAELEAHVSHFVQWLKIAAVRTADSLANQLAGESVAEMSESLKRLLLESMLNGFAALAVANCPARLPAWFVTAATSPLNSTLVDPGKAIEARAAALKEAVEAMAAATAANLAQPKESQPL